MATERRLVEAARERIGITPDHKIRHDGAKAAATVTRLQAQGVEFIGQGWKRFRTIEPISGRAAIDGRRLDLDFDGVDPRDVLNAWSRGDRLVDTGHGFAPLPTEWLQEHGHKVLDLLACRQADGTVATHALPDLARLCEALDAPPPLELEGLRPLLEDFEGLPSVELPEDLTATLRGYQEIGVGWLRFLSQAGLGGVLADDMGLGKTVQALAGLQGRTLVVAPTSVLHNWLREAERFRPALTRCRYHGPQRLMDPKADLVVTTYAILRRDIEQLSAIRWGTVILDEAQAIKNPKSQAAQAAFRLQADFRLAMTGTPVENRLDELWSQIHFTNPGLLGGRKDFNNRYAQPISLGEPGVAAHLRARIRPFILRRTKAEVAPELPPRTDVELRCELSTEERRVYDTVRAAAQQKIVDQLGAGNVLGALEALLRLRQAACHSALIPGQEAEGSSKIDVLVERLTTLSAAGHKALVFSQWTGMLNLIEPHLRVAGIPFVRLDGATRDREACVDSFQSPDGPPVFLISLKAGGIGLNLTAADHVFLMDPWWNPAAEDQAADRAHRIGQDKPVLVTRLVASDTVEERILGLQQKKRALADAALGEADQAARLTRDDLLALLD
jgi:SNF2 family DNA or RNA helicase